MKRTTDDIDDEIHLVEKRLALRRETLDRQLREYRANARARLGSPKLRHHVSVYDAVSFHVQDPGEGGSARGAFTGQWRGVVRPLLEWTVE